jgi:hypothetical protein
MPAMMTQVRPSLAPATIARPPAAPPPAPMPRVMMAPALSTNLDPRAAPPQLNLAAMAAAAPVLARMSPPQLNTAAISAAAPLLAQIKPAAAAPASTSRFAPTTPTRAPTPPPASRFAAQSRPAPPAQRGRSKMATSWISFNATAVAAGATAIMVVKPQANLDVHKLTATCPALTFVISDFRVGVDPVPVASGDTAADVFNGVNNPPFNIGVVPANTEVTITVRNVSAAAADFRASVHGERV